MSDHRTRLLSTIYGQTRRHRAVSHVALASLLAIGLVACGGDDDPAPTPTPSGTATATPTPTSTSTATPTPTSTATPSVVTVNTNFTQAPDAWLAGFADYPRGQEATYQLDQGYNTLPVSLGSGNGYFVSGASVNRDLFLYIYRAVGPSEGLFPNTRYRVRTTLNFGTNAPAGCADRRGEDVIVKAGASNVAPFRGADDFGTNFDKGATNITSGVQVAILGNFAQTTAGGTCAAPTYTAKTLVTPEDNQPIVTTNAAGNAWIVQGLDSGYTGNTRIWFQGSTVVFTPIPTTTTPR